MKRMLALVVAVVAVSSLAYAKKPAPSLEQQIRQVNQQYFDAAWLPDAALYNQIVADDAVIVYRGKYVETGVEVKAWTLHPTGSGPPLRARNVKVVKVAVHGDTAVVFGRLWVRLAEPGGYLSSFTNVFVKRVGRWQLIAASLSPLNRD